MKIRMDEELATWVNYQLKAAMNLDADVDRKEMLISILSEFERCGDAQRYLRRDGKIGWRVTPLLLERLHDAELDASDDLEDDIAP